MIEVKMTNPIILEKLNIDDKILFGKREFFFKSSLCFLIGENGSGKTTLLKIIYLLKAKEQNLHNYYYKLAFENYSLNEPIDLKYRFSLKFMNQDKDLTIGAEFNPKRSNIIFKNIQQINDESSVAILNHIKILYISPRTLLNSEVDEKFPYLSEVEKIEKLFIEQTSYLKNHIILIDELASYFIVGAKREFIENLAQLSEDNQVICSLNKSEYGELSFLMTDLCKIHLKNIYQTTIYNYFAKELKSDFYNEFQKSIQNIRMIIESDLKIFNQNRRGYLIKMLYANVITAMEVYLSDSFIKTVINNEKFFPLLLERVSPFSERKFSTKKAYEWMKDIKDNIINDLSDVSFHNLGRVKSMFKDVLNVKFPEDIGDIFRAINTRHDIIHRNGKTKDDNEINLSSQNVLDLIKNVSSFIEKIETQLKRVDN